jgi:hypothetical protein
VRDLELQLIDSKAQIERKLNAMHETLFSKLDREIKNIANKQAQSDNINSTNFGVASEQFMAFKRYSTDQFSVIADQVALLQAKSDDQAMKVATFSRTVENLKALGGRGSVPEGNL